MKMIGIAQRILLVMSRKIKISTEKKKLLAAFLIFVILILSLGMTQGTLGRFSRSFISTDSATAAEFDVIITAPKEFLPQQDESDFEYRFLSDIDFQVFSFQVANNGEAEILCTPYIAGDITHRIYVEDEVVTNFVVAANETVSFWLVIAPDGLDTSIRNAAFFVDIQQIEGGGILWQE